MSSIRLTFETVLRTFCTTLTNNLWGESRSDDAPLFPRFPGWDGTGAENTIQEGKPGRESVSRSRPVALPYGLLFRENDFSETEGRPSLLLVASGETEFSTEA